MTTNSITAEGRLAKLGIEAKGSTPEELKAHIASEIAKWNGVREKAGIAQEQ